MRESGVQEAEIEKALTFRSMVRPFLDRCVEDVLATGAPIVGFTTTFNQNVASLALAALLKNRAPKLKIVFGGANCDGPMGEALFRGFPAVDAVVRGEGEIVFPSLVKDLLGGGPISEKPGLCFRDEGQVSISPGLPPAVRMDDVPCPDYDEHFERLAQTSYHDALLPQLSITFESARGCWWGEKKHCTFCGLNGSSMKFRSKSADLAFDQLMSLVRRHQHLKLWIVDNIIEMEYFDNLLPRFRDTGYDISIFFETKANLKRWHLQLLRDAGVRTIQPGIESLSTAILTLMRKGVTALQNIRLLKWCAEYGIKPGWNIIIGFPREPEEEYARMAALIPSIVHLPAPSVGNLSVERFSPYQFQSTELGIKLLGPGAWYGHIYPERVNVEDIGFRFRFGYDDDRDVKDYTRPLTEAVAVWAADAEKNVDALQYSEGPDFLVITDRRTGRSAARYILDKVEAKIYLECDAGATPEAISRVLAYKGYSVEDVRELLDSLVEERLMYREGNRYLSLAIPQRPRDAKRPAMVPERRRLPSFA
jgi:ribosomal peptide maturation radical SAM protein 1